MRIYLLLFIILFSSCQEEITFDLPSSSEKIVVEGSIEQGFPPYIILTKNDSYFSPIDSNTYSNLFVYDAEVRVWTYREDGTIHSSILRPIQSILLPPPFDTINVNNLPPIYTGFDLFGEIGKTYFLEIKWNNNIITSSTTIPEPTPLDCVWVEKNPTAQEDYACYIRAVYSDPAEVQNNVLIRSKLPLFN